MNRLIRLLLFAGIVGFLVFPLIVLVASSFTGGSYVEFPPRGVSIKWYVEILRQPEFLQGFFISAVLSVLSTAGAALLGVLAAVALSRYDFRGKGLLWLLYLSPLLLPNIVLGIGLLQLLTYLGLARTFAGLVFGHIVACMPYVVRTVGSTLSLLGRDTEEAAQDLGATRLKAFVLVVLPQIKGALIAGCLFAFAMSWINVEISIFLSGGGINPLPIILYNFIEYSITPLVVSVSAVLIYFSLVLVYVIDRMVSLRRITRL